MFNKIKKNMNMNIKPNKTNKIMILLLSLFLILLNESNNIVYADDIKNVKNGQLKIIPEKITYKYDGIGETEIKSWNNESKQMDKPIKLSEEIIKSIFGNNETTEVTLNYGYLLNRENLKVNTETILNEGLLITDSNVFISVKKNNKLTIGNGSNNEHGIFGIMGVNKNTVIHFINSLFYNKGETIINTENTLILYNKLSSNDDSSYLFKNGSSSITINSKNIYSITINSKNIYISDNELSSTKEYYSILFYNYSTLTLGSDKTERIIIKNNSIEGNNDVCLFYNTDDSSTTINSKNIIDISNNILSSKEEVSYLFYNYGTLTLGSDETERIIIKNNSIEGNKYVYLFYNPYNFSTTINSKNIYISNNELSSTEGDSILFNKGILKLGSDETEMLEIKENKLTGKKYVCLFYNTGDSSINSKNIIDISNNILSSKERRSYLFDNSNILTLGSNKTERIIIKNNSIEGNNDIYLFYNTYNFSTTINSKNIIDISNNILSSKEEASYLFYNYGTLTLGSDKTETIRIEDNKIEGKNNYNSLLFNITESTLNINGSNISIKNNTISGDENKNYYAICNVGTMNINLYYNNDNNPTFEISGNKTTKADKKLTAILIMKQQSNLEMVLKVKVL